MFSNKQTMLFTKSSWDNLQRFCRFFQETDAVIIGAGAGLSAAAGFSYTGKRFYDYFSDFIGKYGLKDMYSAGFYPFADEKEYWAYWSRYVFINRYADKDNGTYKRLFELVKDKDYFVLTTNVDHQFQKAGFDKHRVFYTQGDYGLFQCSVPCRNITYDNEQAIRAMTEQQKNMKIPAELVPHCPVCGRPMTMNLRTDDTFVQDDGWYRASDRYTDFIRKHKGQSILLLELGVGMNTPGIIKYPFWQMTYENPKAVYVCINRNDFFCPRPLLKQSVCIPEDIRAVLTHLAEVCGK